MHKIKVVLTVSSLFPDETLETLLAQLRKELEQQWQFEHVQIEVEE